MFKENINNNNKNKNNANPHNVDSNFQKVNSIMNQRLFGLLDYLRASVYFSRYNDKNNNKKSRNLEAFFKNKIFKKRNPLSFPSLKHINISSNVSEKKDKKRHLNVSVIFKNNKLILQKNKYSTPYDLHLKKQNFLNDMIVFSKHIHSESKMEKNLKEKYPKVESFPLTQKMDMNNFSLLEPKITKLRQLSIKTDGFTSTFDNIFNININNIKRQMHNSKTVLSFRDILKMQKIKNNLRKKKLYINNNNDDNNNNNYIFHNRSNINKIKINNIKSKSNTLLRANVYYNKLHLKKLSKNLEKYTYLNEKNI